MERKRFLKEFLVGSTRQKPLNLAISADLKRIVSLLMRATGKATVFRLHFLTLKFTTSRMGRRIDAVLLIGPVVFVVEAKVGKSENERAADEQVWDCALDLKHFHKASHHASLVPILIATNNPKSGAATIQVDADNVYRPIQVNWAGFRKVIDSTLQQIFGSTLDENQCAQAPYHPTATIIEAARSLYAHHSVDAIKTFGASKRNLRVASRRLEELVDEARNLGRKIICFVTGVRALAKQWLV